MNIENYTLYPLKEDYVYSRYKLGNGKKIMFIGMYTNKKDVFKKTVFTGEQGKVLDNWIKKMDINNYYITNIIKYRLIMKINDNVVNRNPTQKELNMCKLNLDVEIKQYNPDFIIPLGNMVLKFFVEVNDNYLDIVNSIIFKNKSIFYNDIQLIPLFNPSYVVRKKDTIDNIDICKYLLKLKNLLK